MILDSGAIPSHDTFTFTAAGRHGSISNGRPGDPGRGLPARRLTGLVVVRAALVGVLFAVVLATCRRAGLTHRTAAWLTLAAFIVTAVALALGRSCSAWSLCARRLPRRRQARPPEPALAGHPDRRIWANLHGSFSWPLVVGLAWLSDAHDRVPGARQTLGVALVAPWRRA